MIYSLFVVASSVFARGGEAASERSPIAFAVHAALSSVTNAEPQRPGGQWRAAPPIQR